MKKLLILPLLVLTAACGQNKKDVEEDTLTRLSQAVKGNYVDTMTLRLQDFTRQTISNGKLMAVRKSTLRFGTTGTIEQVNFINGQKVREGELIASLDQENASIALAQAENALSKARIDMNDVLIGFGYGDADTSNVPPATMAIARTRSGYDDAEQTYRKALSDLRGTKITAPFSGKVAGIKARVYENAPSEEFCTLIDDSSFEVTFPLLESEIPSVRTGMPVKISPFNNPGKTYTGRITAINPMVDEKGQIQITASVGNSDGNMMDGMNVRVTVEEIIPRQQVVPKSAVVMRDNQDVLFVYQSADSSARWVYVDILMSNSASHVVRVNQERNAQLELGDAVITSGNLNLAHESKVIVRQ